MDMGYKALKFDPFGAAWRIMTPYERQLSCDIVGAVRDVVGPEVQIMVEGHKRFSVHEAIMVADEIEQYKPAWFEEPTDHAADQPRSEDAAEGRRIGLQDMHRVVRQ